MIDEESEWVRDVRPGRENVVWLTPKRRSNPARAREKGSM